MSGKTPRDARFILFAPALYGERCDTAIEVLSGRKGHAGISVDGRSCAISPGLSKAKRASFLHCEPRCIYSRASCERGKNPRSEQAQVTLPDSTLPRRLWPPAGRRRAQYLARVRHPLASLQWSLHRSSAHVFGESRGPCPLLLGMSTRRPSRLYMRTSCS